MGFEINACHLLSHWFPAWFILRLWRWRRYVPPKCHVDFQRTTRCLIPEDKTLHNHRSEDLISYREQNCVSKYCVMCFNPKQAVHVVYHCHKRGQGSRLQSLRVVFTGIVLEWKEKKTKHVTSRVGNTSVSTSHIQASSSSCLTVCLFMYLRVLTEGLLA
jgi:hypothetical protein